MTEKLMREAKKVLRQSREPDPLPPELPRLLTIEQVQDYLGIERRTLVMWRKNPRLSFPKPIRVHGKYQRFIADDVVAWVRSRRAA